MDDELEELRNKVAEKEEEDSIIKEKKELKDKLEKGTVKGVIKKGIKQYFKQFKK